MTAELPPWQASALFLDAARQGTEAIPARKSTDFVKQQGLKSP